MGKLGTKNNPIRVRVSEESRIEEIVRICEENNWHYVCGFEPDQPEDISELEYMLNPKSFAGKQPKMKYIEHMPIVRTEPKIGRNDPCPCGSGRKYKKCCLN